jgi:hypothetical protein
VQAVPQVPQFESEVWVSTQPPPHDVVPVGHVVTHAPMAHRLPVAHTCPHEPQSFASLRRSTHVPEQTLCPTAHWQSPAMQCAPPVHALAHAPQFVSLLRRSTHDPLQSVRPVEQPVGVHVPAEHISALAHAWPHVPQCCGSVATFTHAPAHSISVVPLQIGPSGTSAVSDASAWSTASSASIPVSPRTSKAMSGPPPSPLGR